MSDTGGKTAVCHSWSEDRVERYFLNLLSVEENQSFEGHVLNCPHCQERIEDEMNSLLALRRATHTRQAAARAAAGMGHFAYGL